MVIRRNRVPRLFFISIMLLLAMSAAHVYSEIEKKAVAIISGIEYGSPYVKIDGANEAVEIRVGMKLYEDSMIFSKNENAKISILNLEDTTLLTHLVKINGVLIKDIIKPAATSVTGQLIASIRNFFSNTAKTSNRSQFGGATDGQLNSHPEAEAISSANKPSKQMSTASKQPVLKLTEQLSSDEVASSKKSIQTRSFSGNLALDEDIGDNSPSNDKIGDDYSASQEVDDDSIELSSGYSSAEPNVQESIEGDLQSNEARSSSYGGGGKNSALTSKSGPSSSSPSNLSPAKESIAGSLSPRAGKSKTRRTLIQPQHIALSHSGMAIPERTEIATIKLSRKIQHVLKENKFMVQVITANTSHPKEYSSKKQYLKESDLTTVSIDLQSQASGLMPLEHMRYKISCGNMRQKGWLIVLSAATFEHLSELTKMACETVEPMKRRALLLVAADMWYDCGAFGNAFDIYRQILKFKGLTAKESEQIVSRATEMKRLYKRSPR